MAYSFLAPKFETYGITKTTVRTVCAYIFLVLSQGHEGSIPVSLCKLYNNVVRHPKKHFKLMRNQLVEISKEERTSFRGISFKAGV